MAHRLHQRHQVLNQALGRRGAPLVQLLSPTEKYLQPASLLTHPHAPTHPPSPPTLTRAA